MNYAFIAVLFALALSLTFGALAAGVVRRQRNALANSTQQANEARGQVTLLRGEVALLDAALARRDQSLAEVSRELGALRAVLQEDEAPVRHVFAVQGASLALAALESLARDGYGPTFTQGAVHAGGEVQVFGPSQADFGQAILRVAEGRRLASARALTGSRAAGVVVLDEDGPEFSDGHDPQGFPGGCARAGCPGGDQCPEARSHE